MTTARRLAGRWRDWATLAAAVVFAVVLAWSTYQVGLMRSQNDALAQALEQQRKQAQESGQEPVAPAPEDIIRDPTVVTGPEGPQGPRGQDGRNGVDGSPGATGPPGVRGATGEDGAAGAPGASGVQGPQGEQGPPGEQGPRGETGAVGPAGPQGEAGPAGPECPDGTHAEAIIVLTNEGTREIATCVKDSAARRR